MIGRSSTAAGGFALYFLGMQIKHFGLWTIVNIGMVQNNPFFG
jgi:hypothetical protein